MDQTRIFHVTGWEEYWICDRTEKNPDSWDYILANEKKLGFSC